MSQTCTTGAPTCGPEWIGGANPPGTTTVVRALTTWDPDHTVTTNGPLIPILVAGFSNGGTSGVATWDGLNWTTLTSSITGTVDAFTVDGDGTLYAGGQFSSIGGVSANNVAYWLGGAWHAMGSGTNGRVRALCISPLDSTIVAGGDFTQAGGSTVNYIASWSGSAWSSVGSGTNGSVTALGVDPNYNLTAGGSFTSAGGSSIGRGIASWDGTSWSALGSGIGDSSVSCLTQLSTGDLVAGGSFTSAGGVSSTSRIARWDGTNWHAMGSGFDGSVDSLFPLTGGKLVAGGSFAASSTTSMNRIARWTGSAWASMGGGVGGASSDVLAIAKIPSAEIVAGGVFTIAGSNAAQNFGRWSDTGKPWIGVQPVKGRAVTLTGNATITATAAPGYDSAGALSYEWKLGTHVITNGTGGASTGGGTVSGATTSSLTITGLATSDLGSFTVKMSNSCGYIVSGTSTLGLACLADQNQDGVLNVQDIFDFLSDWFALCTSTNLPTCHRTADYNQSGTITTQDIFDFLSGWFAGCS